MTDFLFSWSEWIVIILVAAAVFTLGFLLCSIVDSLFQRFVYFVHRKTRFNRKPIAKCYCRDCEKK